MKRQIPNILSGSRVIAAVILLFLNQFSNTFIYIYIFCGITDLLDGPIARKLNIESMVGTVLDTTGDFITYIAMAKIIVMQKIVPLWAYIWMLCALTSLLVGGYIAKVRFNKFYMVHSLFSKIFGVVLFFLPIGFRIMDINIYLLILCICTTIAGIESIFIQSQSKFPHDNVILISKAISETQPPTADGVKATKKTT